MYKSYAFHCIRLRGKEDKDRFTGEERECGCSEPLRNK